jgi:methylated-DNA-[protein]-cysteine S-methyltransferase
MSKPKREKAGESACGGEIRHTPPVRLPHGLASLILCGGRILAVAWEPSERKLFARIRAAYPAARPACGPPETAPVFLERYAAADFPAAAELLALPFAWERVSAFDRKVLLAAASIPPGLTASYAEVAARSGTPRAARAAGGALGRNPWPVLIPCHRVVGSDGRLTGFGKGLAAKRALLLFEGSSSR